MTRPPRIPPVSDPNESQRAELAKTLLEPGAEPLNLFTTLAHHPLLLKRVNALGGAFLEHGQLPPRERELAILRVAYRLRSQYEFAHHVAIAGRVGLTAEEIDASTEDIKSPDRRPKALALLRFVDELIDDETVNESSWDAVARDMSQGELIELILLVGYYRMVAVFLSAARVPLEDHLSTPTWSDASSDTWSNGRSSASID